MVMIIRKVLKIRLDDGIDADVVEESHGSKNGLPSEEKRFRKCVICKKTIDCKHDAHWPTPHHGPICGNHGMEEIIKSLDLKGKDREDFKRAYLFVLQLKGNLVRAIRDGLIDPPSG